MTFMCPDIYVSKRRLYVTLNEVKGLSNKYWFSAAIRNKSVS